jgi:hypothetical protein
MSRIIKRIEGVLHRDGGEVHRGWLPPGAAIPLPTPVRDLVLNLMVEELDGGYLLIGVSQDGSMDFDFWFDTLEAAIKAADEWFGVPASDWEDGV